MRGERNSRGWGRRAVILVPYLWLAIFFLAPFVIVLKISLSQSVLAQPPYTPVLDLTAGWQGLKTFAAQLSLDSFGLLASDSLYLLSYFKSLQVAAVSTVLLFALGYPIAYGMARAPKAWQPMLVMAVVLPFWTSFLLRVYAWKGLLMENGWVWWLLTRTHADLLLLHAQLIDTPGVLMNTRFALLVGMVYTYLPFMILPLYSTLARLDGRLLEASADLGATPWVTFWRVTVPLSRPGIVAGSMLVFIPCIGEYVIPEMLGGPTVLMIGRVLWDEFFSNYDWPMASAVAVVVILMILVPLAWFNRYQAEATEGRA